MKWIQALKEWNGQSTHLNVAHKDVWAIPKKNTEPYEEVKDITKPDYPMRKAVSQLRKVEEETKQRNKQRQEEANKQKALKEIESYGKPKPREKRKLKSVSLSLKTDSKPKEEPKTNNMNKAIAQLRQVEKETQDRNQKRRMEKAISQLREVEKATQERNKKRMERAEEIKAQPILRKIKNLSKKFIPVIALHKEKGKLKEKKKQFDEMISQVNSYNNYKPLLDTTIDKIESLAQGFKALWEKHIQEIADRRKKQEAYNENIKPIERVLKVGDVILDDEDGNEWIVLEVNEKESYTLIKKRRGRNEVKIFRYETQKTKEPYWEQEEEPDSDGGYDADFQPLMFSQMFKDPSFKS